MMAKIVKRDQKRKPTHPGEILWEDILPALAITVSEVAEELGISRQTLHRVLAAKLSVSPAMALRLGKFCGNDAAVWLNMQRTYDLWHAERKLSKNLSRIKTLKVVA